MLGTVTTDIALDVETPHTTDSILSLGQGSSIMKRMIHCSIDAKSSCQDRLLHPQCTDLVPTDRFWAKTCKGAVTQSLRVVMADD